MALFVITAGNRDAKEEAGTVTVTGNAADHDHDASTDWSGFSFVPNTGANGAGPKQGATINSASVTICVSTTGADEPAVTFWGHDADNSGIFTTGANDISSRTPTTASVTWSVADLAAAANDRVTITPTTGTWEAIIQEIVDRPGYAQNNPITFICQGFLTGSATRDLQYRFYEYTGAGGTDPVGTYAPQLTMTWTDPAASPVPVFAHHLRQQGIS